MMLVDGGALVALLNARDSAHGRCREAAAGAKTPLATVWPALLPALAALAPWPEGCDAVFEMIARGALRILPLGEDELRRVRELTRGARSRSGLDLELACFVAAAEREGLDTVLSLERAAFERCRLQGRRRFRVLPGRRRPRG